MRRRHDNAFALLRESVRQFLGHRVDQTFGDDGPLSGQRLIMPAANRSKCPIHSFRRRTNDPAL